ncbi:MAG: phenol hydroxylase [Alphaproteobacteria bacterium]|nr:MAG: phenol hydroxylase [Alphaproteobacteria bacterium]
MSLDIKTSVIKPKRQTYLNLAERFGEDRPASRYEEATYDMQPSANFHYRPTWDPAHLLYDPARTAIKMADWYAFKDPRQLYYGTYTIARNKLMDACETNFAFVEKRGLVATVEQAWSEKVARYLLPLRHYEWGANMNNTNITHVGYGTAITQACIFAAMDRLGIAQILSRIGLLLDGNTGTVLGKTRETWVEDPMWQDLRRAVEDSFVLDDWFEQLVAQNLALDGFVFPLVYDHCDRAGLAHGGTALSMLTEFMIDWYADHCRWVDQLVKVTAAESPENAARLGRWAGQWMARAEHAVAPLAEYVLADEAAAALRAVREGLYTRLKKAGLAMAENAS